MTSTHAKIATAVVIVVLCAGLTLYIVYGPAVVRQSATNTLSTLAGAARFNDRTGVDTRTATDTPSGNGVTRAESTANADGTVNLGTGAGNDAANYLF